MARIRFVPCYVSASNSLRACMIQRAALHSVHVFCTSSPLLTSVLNGKSLL